MSFDIAKYNTEEESIEEMLTKIKDATKVRNKKDSLLNSRTHFKDKIYEDIKDIFIENGFSKGKFHELTSNDVKVKITETTVEDEDIYLKINIEITARQKRGDFNIEVKVTDIEKEKTEIKLENSKNSYPIEYMELKKDMKEIIKDGLAIIKNKLI